MSEQNPNQLLIDNDGLRKQIAYLENMLRSALPAPAAPDYPKMELPESPVVAGQTAPEAARMDCEGVVQTGEVAPVLVPVPAPGKARIMIGIPLLDVKYEFFESFLKFWTELCLRPDRPYEIAYHFAFRKPVHMAEEYLVKTAIANHCTHILFMDDDIYDINMDMLNKLFYADKDVIGGIMHASKFPHAMCAFRRYDPSKKVTDMPADNSMYRLYEIPATCPSCNSGQTHWDVKFCPSCGTKINIEVQKADLIPFAFTLMKLSVFDKIKKPWFHCTTTYPTDSWFADRLLEVGLEEYAHMTVRLNHAGVTDATKPHFMNIGMIGAQQKKAVVNLTPEQMDMHQNLLVSRMKQVEDSIKPKLPFIGDEKSLDALKETGTTQVTAPSARY
mgnify:CR=1 FL=1